MLNKIMKLEQKKVPGEYHPVLEYETLVNTPFDIRSMGGDNIYIDGYIFYDFRKVKRHINKNNKRRK